MLYCSSPGGINTAHRKSLILSQHCQRHTCSVCLWQCAWFLNETTALLFCEFGFLWGMKPWTRRWAYHVAKMGETYNVHIMFVGLKTATLTFFFYFFGLLRIRCHFFWDVTLSHLVFGFRRFETAYWTHLQRHLDPWRWEKYVVWEHRDPNTDWRSGTYQSTRYLSHIEVREVDSLTLKWISGK